ncbi:MAG: thioredoxin family protein [Synergistaceae bacterium]|nr:thioredoxin family protein [Synergistaceae bacterium]
MAITEITKENFSTEVSGSSLPVVLDFWGPRCGHCMELMPGYHELAGNPKYEGRVKFCSVDTSTNRRVAMTLRPAVMSLPTFIFFKGGKETARLSGGNITIEAVASKADELLG